MRWLILGLLLAGCHADGPSPASTPTTASVKVETAGKHTVTRHVELPADVYPYQKADLHARVSGFIEAIYADRGDHVTRGQLLAKVRLPEAERELAQARATASRGQAELAAAQARLPRAQAEQSAARADYLRALAQQQQLAAELTKAQALEGQTRVEQRLAEANYARLQGIAKEDAGLVAIQDLDVSRTTVDVARQKVNSARSAVNSARQSLSAGQAAVASARSRLDANASSVVVAQAQLKSSTFQGEADLHVAEKVAEMLAYTEIRAPFAGTITGRSMDPGALVQAASSGQSSTRPVFQLADFDKVRVRVELPQEFAVDTERGTPAEVRADKQVFKAKVSRVSGSLDMAARTMVAEVDVSNREHRLRPGMYVKVVLALGAHANVLSVPTSALVIDGSKRWVGVVQDGKLKRTPVEVGLGNPKLTEILAGLKGGETVIASGAGKLLDGTPVTITR